ncbi:MAG: ATP-binding cassette domain-containing protein, partial [Rhodospirillales bacterium]|nr:ATP-binding cassette domain-containing protein [Rhodospirillales bacterium]
MRRPLRTLLRLLVVLPMLAAALAVMLVWHTLPAGTLAGGDITAAIPGLSAPVEIGIDADGFRSCAEQAAHSIEARQLRESLAGRALGLGADEALARAHALISELRLDVIRHLDAGQLSGGQMKLLEFGVCFMVPPRIALLDEPFAAVHPTMKEIMG